MTHEYIHYIQIPLRNFSNLFGAMQFKMNVENFGILHKTSYFGSYTFTHIYGVPTYMYVCMYVCICMHICIN